MTLWVDEYRPWSLEDAELHVNVNGSLRGLASSPATVPHLLFYGPEGAGKRTRIMAFLREMFGTSVFRVQVSNRSFKVPNKRDEITLTTLHSNYHIELTPADVGLSDRHVIQHLFREIADTGSVRPIVALDHDDAKKEKELTTKKYGFKVVVINLADRLSRDAQAALRRTMEKYMATCRVIMCCEYLTHVIEPIRSRCQLIRVPKPTVAQLAPLLQSIAQRQALLLSDQLATHIVNIADRNIRLAILLLQSIRSSLNPLATPLVKSTALVADGGVGGGDKKVCFPTVDWKEQIVELANGMLGEQSIAMIQRCREKLIEWLSHPIPADEILKHLVEALYPKVKDSIAIFISKLAAECDVRLNKGTKPILHLEFFTTHLLSHLAQLPPT